MLESNLPSHFDQKPIDCVRVDGATDEGPGHLEVQFLWTERHLEKRKICTVVSSRHSGGSYLNEVELMNGCIAKAHANLYIPSTLSGSNFHANGLNTKKLSENLDIGTDVYIDRVNGAACCGTTLQLHNGGKNEAATERRESLLVFLKGKAEEKMKLKENKPELFKFFEKVWMVRSNHMNKDLPPNYVFMLNLCYQPECPHPLCGNDAVRRDLKWYENGPPLQCLPVPIPDPKRPWGGNCQNCTTVCSGHYLKPQEREEFVKENGLTLSMFKPPSAVIKEKFYESLKNRITLSESELMEVAKTTLLSVEELKMHIEHLRTTVERRKEGAKKAALTRKAKGKTIPAKKVDRAKKADKDHAAEKPVLCWCREEEGGDMLLCEGKSCPIKWFHFKCVGLLFSPAFCWFCPDCNDESEQYCLCNQAEYGLMLACDNAKCSIMWFHLSCVGLATAPEGEWLCPKCA